MATISVSRNECAVHHLSGLLRNAAMSKEPLLENTVGANDEIQGIRDVFNADWYFALSEFDQEIESLNRSRSSDDSKRSEAVSKLQAAWVAALSAGMFRSFRRGYGSRGRADSSTLNNEKVLEEDPAFRAVLEKHAAFANQFAQQYASGRTDRKGAMGVGARTNMYGQALKAAYNAGAVHGGVTEEKIHWRLGACDHCVDCPAISVSGPYTRNTLPTYPGNGDTICKTNCCCYLVFTRGAKKVSEPNSLGSFLSDGDSVEEDTTEPMRSLQDLVLRRSYLRRYVFLENITSSEKSEAARDISSISKRISSEAEGIGVPQVASYNPGGVITSADISFNDIASIFNSGLDGPSIFRADSDGAMREIERVSRLYSDKIERVTRVPKGEGEEGRLPQIGGFSTFNVVDDGATRTLQTLASLYKILSETELFVEIGALDDSMDRVVGYSGIWIRGQTDEVAECLRLLSEMQPSALSVEVIQV